MKFLKLAFFIFLCVIVSRNSFAEIQSDCGAKILTSALYQNQHNIMETDTENVVKAWIYSTYQHPDVLKYILKCPEFANGKDTDIIKIGPVEYVFPQGRQIIVNYKTQPKILHEKLALDSKRNITDLNPNPEISEHSEGIWTNTDPAWYGILVVQKNSLSQFIGADKNNTVSLKYIEENIKSIHPNGNKCTSTSALSKDTNAVNLAVAEIVNIEDDTNDYYVAGDANLGWITWGQVALDVAITVATVGTGSVILGATKTARATRAAKNLVSSIKNLEKAADVADYVRISKLIKQSENTLDTIDKAGAIKKSKTFTDYATKLADLKKAKVDLATITNQAQYNSKLNEIAQMENTLNGLRQNPAIQNFLQSGIDIEKYTDTMNDIRRATPEKARLEKTSDVQKYLSYSKSLDDVMRLRNNLKAWKTPQKGNVAAKSLRTLNATIKTLRATNSTKTINKAAKAGRASLKSGRTRDWLFQNTLKNIGLIGKYQRNLGLLYGAVNFIGNMYDWSSTTSAEFTNNIDFKPLGLLSADDLEGQTNIVNHGMWLMWVGNSTSPADDDAAYLQSMDFASKFYTMLDTVQEKNGTGCDVDIYVVRPVIYHANPDNTALYYLVMNDIPWTVEPY